MSSVPNYPIGVFDSGVGGLTVAREIVTRLPREQILYLGDTARVPYGNKSPETIQRYSLTIAQTLQRAHAKVIVVACNTASAYSLEALTERFQIPIIGVISPVARQAATVTSSGAVGVIGTRGTVASGAYDRALKAVDPTLEIYTQACPLFVPLAEEGWISGEVPQRVAERYLAPLAAAPIDVLILGCTHYPLLAPIIEKTLSTLAQRHIRVLDSATATSEALEATLISAGKMATSQTSAPEHQFWMTDSSPTFLEACGRFFGAPVSSVEHVDLIPFTS